MKTYILNIGMNTNTGGSYTRGFLFNAFRIVGICPIDTKYHQSDTEETAVCTFDKRPTHSEINRLCELLGQDCIAIASEDRGLLVGPLAKKWGPFNPSYFLMPDGSRMSATK